GKRVSKSCIEMSAIGEVDELNTAVGLIISELKRDKDFVGRDVALLRLYGVQHLLFNLGGMIAAVQTDLISVPKVTMHHITELEQWIDEMETMLTPLTQFILPGGHHAAGRSFMARAICRRAERSVVMLKQRYEDLDPTIQQFLNRLSDALFVLGRLINKKYGVEDVVWKK
ncbi:MAG: cob(I)yrinic acid a,c-diamide adenosyltransferase, partial [Patescibacteria group bacterium]